MSESQTEFTIRLSSEREPGCVRSVDPIVRALEQADFADIALLMYVLYKAKGENDEQATSHS